VRDVEWEDGITGLVLRLGGSASVESFFSVLGSWRAIAGLDTHIYTYI